MGVVRFRYRAGCEGQRQEGGKSGSWWADTRVAGRREVFRLPTARTKAEAERLLREHEERAYRVSRGLDVSASRALTFEEATRRYLETVQHLVSGERIRRHLEQYVLPHLGRRLLPEVTGHDVDALASRLLRTLEASTVELVLKRVSALYTWARRARVYRGPSPLEDASRLEVPRRLPLHFTAAERDAIIAHAPRYALAIEAAFWTGARLSELRGWQWADVDWDAAVWTVRRSGARDTTKTGAERLVPLTPHLVQRLREERLRTRGALVLAAPRGELLSAFALQHAFREAMVAAKVEPRGRSFRHTRSTFATLLLELTGDVYLVQRLLGHTTPAITARAYAHGGLEYLRRGVAMLSAPRSDGAVTPTPGNGRAGGQPSGKTTTKTSG